MHAIARCPNCDANTAAFRPLDEVEDLAKKLSLRIGDEVPAGECSKCGSFVYSVDVDRIGKAIGTLQKDYYDDVRGLVESIKDEIKDGDITSMEHLQDRLHEDCDGAQRVIYTQQAKLALVFSDNDDAYEQEFGGDMPEWSHLAYCAFYRDVQEHLDVEECEDCDNALATVEHDGDQLCQECYKARLEAEEQKESDDE